MVRIHLLSLLKSKRRKKMKRLNQMFPVFAAVLIMVGVFGASRAFAIECDTQDKEGKDISYLPRFPGSVRIEYKHDDYGFFKFLIKWSESNTDEKAVEGAYTHVTYELCASASKLQILRNYENAFKNKGWKIIVPVNLEHLDQTPTIVAEKVDAQNDIWAQINIWDRDKDEQGLNYSTIYMDVVEVKKMKQEIELDESQMKKDLDSTGKVVLHGINFDTGKATIKDDSKPLLDEIGKLLTDNKDLKLSIEGHTDNVGDKAANQKLSEARAAAVKDYLVKNAKVDGARLTTKGFGDTKPIADNGTDAGKASNRRVELVKVK